MLLARDVEKSTTVNDFRQSPWETGNLLRSCLLGLLIISATAANAKLPFIQDNYAKARAEALERKVPIFVECWAPW